MKEMRVEIRRKLFLFNCQKLLHTNLMNIKQYCKIMGLFYFFSLTIFSLCSTRYFIKCIGHCTVQYSTVHRGSSLVFLFEYIALFDQKYWIQFKYLAHILPRYFFIFV